MHPILTLKWQVRLRAHRVGFWAPADRARLALSYWAGIPHERDFRFFSHFRDEAGLFADIGANAGQSAYSFAIFNRSSPILSFEPNPDHESDLRMVKRVLGSRFDYKLIGLGNQTETTLLHIPRVDGVPFTQEATLDRQVLDGGLALERIKKSTGAGPERIQITSMQLKVETFDSLNLNPAFIKIDAQGAELPALMGMTQTLQRCHPILMIESSPDGDAIERLLSPMGYKIYTYDPKKDRIVQHSSQLALNQFFIPEHRLGELSNRALID